MEYPGGNGSFYVQWHLLDRCNLRCLHCYQHKFSREGELEWPGLKLVADNLLDTMASWGTTLDVALTGGEPFLKDELLDLLTYLDHSIYVGTISIISNGTIIPPWLNQLANLSKLHEIRISLDGISPDSNDGIRGKGSLAKVLDNLPQWKKFGIPVTFMFTVMKRNLHDVEGLLDFGKKTGVNGIIIERFFPLGQGESLEKEVLDGREFLGVWSTILEQSGISTDPAELIPYRAIRVSFQDPEPEVLGSGCVVAQDGMALLPDGTVLPCRRFTLPIGNLLRLPLDRVWHESPVLNALRDRHRLKGKCGSCPIDDCLGCRAMCFALYNDFLAEDPHCWIDI